MTIEQLYDIFLKANHVNTDTRSIQKNDLFFALSGPNFNGNKFAVEALKKGAYAAVIDDKDFINEHTILVEDTLETLQQLATYHRKQLNLPIIALTGSNGKTTTKELINSVLSKKYNTTATLGNLNNDIGVPLTLLSITKETEIGIVEMGANHLKEIKQLASIALPDYGYITNFGKAHLEGFGGIEGVIKGKSELYDHLRARQKTAFINSEDKTQLEQAGTIKKHTFSQKDNSDTCIKLIEAKPNVYVKYKGLEIKSNLIGAYNFNNIAAAICIGGYFNVNKDDIKDAIESYIPTNNRSQIVNKNSNKIILDAYNANPTSMKAALENFNQLNATEKTIFIGDMFELGNSSNEEHQKIIDYIDTLNFNNIYILGEHFSKTKHSSNIHSYKDFKAFSEDFNKKLTNNTILIKGSRGMALERILELL